MKSIKQKNWTSMSIFSRWWKPKPATHINNSGYKHLLNPYNEYIQIMCGCIRITSSTCSNIQRSSCTEQITNTLLPWMIPHPIIPWLCIDRYKWTTNCSITSPFAMPSYLPSFDTGEKSQGICSLGDRFHLTLSIRREHSWLEVLWH